MQADFNTTVNSWIEQRLFVTNAPKLLEREHPALAKSLVAALEQLRDVNPPSTAHLQRVLPDPSTALFACGGHTVGFDRRGALTTLDTADGTAWASPQHPVGLYQYQTFTNEDYNVFLQDFASRVDGPGCGHYAPGSADDSSCRNFRKPNVTSAMPKRRVVLPELTGLWHSNSSSGCGGGADDRDRSEASASRSSRGPGRTNQCEFVVEMALDSAGDAHAAAGAPARLAYRVGVSNAGITWEVVQVDKPPTRLPEAAFFSFVPAAAAAEPEGWRLHVLGSVMNPIDVLGSGPGGAAVNQSVYGGSPHLRGVEAVTWKPPPPKAATAAAAATKSNKPARLAVKISSLDVPVVAVGAATPFPSPRTGPPDMSRGVHFNILQNIW
jgi:hypothetical protein